MSGTSSTIHLDPPIGEWKSIAVGRWRSLSEAGRAARSALGLPTDRPVIMSGHQASFWHCGIAAKVFAGASVAGACGGIAAWVVVDQDESSHHVIRAPVRDGKGLLRVQDLRVCDEPAGGVPPASLPSFEARALRPTGAAFALPSVSWGAASITESLLSRRSEPTAARQVAGATFDLLESHATRPALLFASELADVASFATLVEQMAGEAPRAIGAYNEAVAAHPAAGITPLLADASRRRWELPLWRLQPGRPRQRVFSDEIASDGLLGLAPRALMLTAFLRLGACDLFIHGKGGAIYDRATEEWIARWLGANLAPTVMASADVLLPFVEAGVTERDAARAVWRAHHARHDPSLGGRPELASRKRSLVEAIRGTRESGGDALPGYRDLQQLLETYRDQERGRLRDLRDEAERLVAVAASGSIARDRTWAFPFQRAEALAALRAALIVR